MLGVQRPHAGARQLPCATMVLRGIGTLTCRSHRRFQSTLANQAHRARLVGKPKHALRQHAWEQWPRLLHCRLWFHLHRPPHQATLGAPTRQCKPWRMEVAASRMAMATILRTQSAISNSFHRYLVLLALSLFCCSPPVLFTCSSFLPLHLQPPPLQSFMATVNASVSLLCVRVHTRVRMCTNACVRICTCICTHQ